MLASMNIPFYFPSAFFIWYFVQYATPCAGFGLKPMCPLIFSGDESNNDEWASYRDWNHYTYGWSNLPTSGNWGLLTPVF